MATVEEIWDRIHTWLSENAAGVLGVLRVGATEEQLQKLEEKLETELPEDFKTSYRIHNGSSGGPLFHDHMFLSVDDIDNEWSINTSVQKENEAASPPTTEAQDDSVAESEPKEATPLKMQDKWWDPKWVPFGSYGNGDSIVVDLVPAEAGTMGQVFEWSHEGGAFVWRAANFTEYLQNFADDLEAGNYKVRDENSDCLERVDLMVNPQ